MESYLLSLGSLRGSPLSCCEETQPPHANTHVAKNRTLAMSKPSWSKFSNPGQSFDALADILMSRREKWVIETCVLTSIQHSFQYDFIISFGLPWGLRSKESTCQSRRCRFNFWDGKIPWRRKWQPTPVFLPRKSHGQRSLAGYSAWGYKESDTT